MSDQPAWMSGAKKYRKSELISKKWLRKWRSPEATVRKSA